MAEVATALPKLMTGTTISNADNRTARKKVTADPPLGSGSHTHTKASAATIRK